MMLRLVHTLLICFALLHATSATGMPAPAQNPSPTKNQSIPDPCGRFGKLFSATVGMANSFEQDTLVHTRVLTDTGYQTKLKPIKDIAVGDEVLAWDELQAHDNAALAAAGQAAPTLQEAHNAQNSTLQANLTVKTATNPSKSSPSSYENNSTGNINSVNNANINALIQPTSAQRYEKVTDTISSLIEQTLLHITLDNGQYIQATAGHPFKTLEGWRDAVLLKKGGKLLLRNEDTTSKVVANTAERYATITDIREEIKTIAVFNLEVANLHTFFVGVDGVVVHNGRCTPKMRKQWEDIHGQSWPKNPLTERIRPGGNQDGHHIIPKSKGGIDHGSNIQPMTPTDHTAHHRQHGYR
jgi:hypothetical protein